MLLWNSKASLRCSTALLEKTVTSLQSRLQPLELCTSRLRSGCRGWRTRIQSRDNAVAAAVRRVMVEEAGLVAVAAAAAGPPEVDGAVAVVAGGGRWKWRAGESWRATIMFARCSIHSTPLLCIPNTNTDTHTHQTNQPNTIPIPPSQPTTTTDYDHNTHTARPTTRREHREERNVKKNMRIRRKKKGEERKLN